MLVISRRVDEALMIGDGIEVRVLRIGRSGVRLGIIAPASVPVHRREVYERVCDTNREAATDPAAISRLLAQMGAVRPADTDHD